MRNWKIIAIAILALALGACSTTETVEPIIAAPVAETIEVPAIETIVVEAPVLTRIPVGTVLGTLVDSGCEIEKVIYREVKRGGGIEVTCRKTLDALNTSIGNL